MKYRRPKDICWMNVDLKEFLDSLPSEFEIVPEGYSCVKWPNEATKDNLDYAARRLSYNASAGEARAKHYLFVLAAIAPERKGRRVNLWERECKDYIERRWVYEGEVLNDKVWRKVAGPIEIDD